MHLNQNNLNIEYCRDKKQEIKMKLQKYTLLLVINTMLIDVSYQVYVDQYGCGGISGEQVYTYSGSSVPPALELYSCYRVRIQFHSDVSVQGAGFSINYSAGYTTGTDIHSNYVYYYFENSHLM